MNFIDVIKKRRSQYALTNTVSVSEEKIIETITEVIKHNPSAYNVQSTRVMILLGENHKKFWNITKDVLLESIGQERFVSTEKKINSCFLSGYGTVLFFIDEDVVKENAEKISNNFYVWSDESAGMAQVSVWLGLSALGIGANLQHYNPLVDEKVKDVFNVPLNWKLVSQMPFGDIIAEPKEKEFKEINELVIVKK
ncbi:MAG: nitroreductase family protein [Treponema sp.]|nr:nitroreductase family protein [Treponema sp.]